jgi:hypothetical protein
MKINILKNVLLIFFGLLFIIQFNGCKKEDPITTLSISITQQPTGSLNVETISIKYTGTLNFEEGKPKNNKGNVKSISATIEWWWEAADHSKSEILKSESTTFGVEGNSEKSSVYGNPGYYLLNYYWVVISWSDDLGSHSIKSDKVFLYNKK